MSLVDRFKWLAIRRPKLRKLNSSAHWLTYIDPTTELAGNNTFGKGTHIHGSKIGRHSYVASARIVNTTIGTFCSIGPGVKIGGLGIHPTDCLSTHPAFYSTLMQSGKTFATTNLFEELKSNTVGNDVWIGARVLVLDGISIGDGAIVAAGAVVTKNVPPYSIVGGVPARLIRSRFGSAEIEFLLKWQWWNLPDGVLTQLSLRFCDASNLTLEKLVTLERDASEAALGKVKDSGQTRFT